jgi:hypothetical protein
LRHIAHVISDVSASGKCTNACLRTIDTQRLVIREASLRRTLAGSVIPLHLCYVSREESYRSWQSPSILRRSIVEARAINKLSCDY